jgi:hypothetical protein
MLGVKLTARLTYFRARGFHRRSLATCNESSESESVLAVSMLSR